MRYFRKVLKITALDSPNVRYALAQQRAGIVPTGEVLVPGVLPWSEYQKRLKLWDKVRQTVGLWGTFYEGEALLLYPPEWLNHAEWVAEGLKGRRRLARALGVDSGEGGDKSAWAVVDEMGLIELRAYKTPNTAVVTSDTLALMRHYAIDPQNVAFDRGGGGKEHADRLRAQGYKVRTVGFGEGVSLEPKRGMRLVEERLNSREERYSYKNRRAEMYGTLRVLLDPSLNPDGFGLPAAYTALREQLAPIPLLRDEEGRLFLPPKTRRGVAGQDLNLDGASPRRGQKTLDEIIGHSPDEADALVLAVHAMLSKPMRARAGAAA